MFEKPYPMARVLEFVDVGPYLGRPALVVRRRLPAGGAPGMERDLHRLDPDRSCARQLDEDTSHFLHLFAVTENVFIAQQVSKTEFLGLGFRLGAGVKRAILRP